MKFKEFTNTMEAINFTNKLLKKGKAYSMQFENNRIQIGYR